MSLSLVNNALQVLSFLTILAFLIRVKIPAWWSWGLASAALVVLAAFTYQDFPSGIDAKHFYNAGRDVWDGHDPYARPQFLNLPTALPVYALLALASFTAFLAVWNVLNVVGYATVVPFTQLAISDPNGTDTWKLAPTGMAVLTAALAVCYSTRHAMILGQLSLAILLILLAALWFQGRCKPIVAGLCLAIASIKVNTMMPFLLLFLRKKDWSAWAAMIVAGLVLSLATAPGELPGHLAGCLNNIKQASEPGAVNDYSFAGKNNPELISFDHAVYHLGVRDRTVVRLASLTLTVLLGAWAGWEVLRPPALGRAAGCAIVAAYAAVFLYHRGYDMIVLIIPLAYAAGCAVTVAGRVRWLYVASALACLLVLDLRVSWLEKLGARVQEGGTANRLLEAVILPYGTWLVVGLIVMLVVAERYQRTLPAASVGGQENPVE